MKPVIVTLSILVLCSTSAAIYFFNDARTQRDNIKTISKNLSQLRVQLAVVDGQNLTAWQENSNTIFELRRELEKYKPVKVSSKLTGAK